MVLRNIIFAGVGAFALSSCAPPPLTADALLFQPYARPSAAPFDVAAFFGATPAWLETSFESADFDPSTGAMVVRDLTFALRDAPDYRLRVDRADIWGGDVAAMAALQAGAADAAQMFERASFQGVRSEGLQWRDGTQSAAFRVDKVVYDGLAASGASIALKDDAALIQKFAALSSAYKFDGAAYSNLTLKMNESRGGEALLAIAQGFVRGYDGGRTDYERIDGLSLTTRPGAHDGVLQDVAGRLEQRRNPRPEDKILQPGAREALNRALDNPVAFIAARSGGRAVKYEIDSIDVRNADIAGGLRWLAKWEAPPIAETELLDFGSMTILGHREFWNGTLAASIARCDVYASDFYWLVPSNIRMRVTDYSVALLDMVDIFTAANGLGLTPETGSREIQRLRRAIAAFELQTLRADFAFGWNWNGETGALEADFSQDVVDLAATSFAIGLGGPPLAEWDRLVRENAPAEEVAKRIFLRALSYRIVDDQLLDRAFAYAAQESGGAAEDLRAALPATIRLSGAEAADMNARVPGYIDAVANFIAQGGALDVSMHPDPPIALDALQSIGDSAPQTLPDVLDLEIVHTPP